VLPIQSGREDWLDDPAATDRRIPSPARCSRQDAIGGGAWTDRETPRGWRVPPVRDADPRDGKEGSAIDIDEFAPELDDGIGAEPGPGSRRKKAPWLLEPDGQEEADLGQVLAKLARVARRLREIHATDPGAADGPASDGEWLAAIPGLLLEEGLWLDQAVTSHDKHDDLSIVTIDFRWTDVATGQTLGPRTFIGYGRDEGEGGIERALAATVRSFLRHTFLIRLGDASEGIARTPAVFRAARRPSPSRPLAD